MAWNWLMSLFGRGRESAERDSLEPADWETDTTPEDAEADAPEDEDVPEDEDDETATESPDEDDPIDDPLEKKPELTIDSEETPPEEDDEFAALEPAPLDEPDDDGFDLSWASSFTQSNDDPEEQADGGVDEEVVDDLRYRTESLEESIEDTEMRLDAIQDSQEQVVSQVDELNDRVRRLLGLYDQVTDDINPFTGEGEADSGFEVFGGASADDGETVSFDDLKEDVEVEPVADLEEDDPAPEPEPEPEPDPQPIDTPADAPTLRTLPDTYATDVVVFEWLATLLESGGPRATLEALSYYVELGWIDEDVRAHLETVLSGPGLADVDADPSGSLTAADHADSYAYVVQLREIGEIRRTVDP
ncbi:FlaD/FlaE family flagellar protein [Natronococcus occultus]|uniref:Putative archaeal flagellar protein D/E n=1 Tax=Natronococcus occultus SP4 TaxID=694430 RepID=L0K1W4_9EURY|nr:FlaD/FlaE family flagellar protein [Natronococcus occultus]AGB38108.1 putative archaeal flagellar protein D/E [Natronococcus occultus SP4]